MPAGIKLVVSALVAVVALVTWYVESAVVGRDDLGWLALGVGALMIVAMWIFPEAAAKSGRKRP